MTRESAPARVFGVVLFASALAAGATAETVPKTKPAVVSRPAPARPMPKGSGATDDIVARIGSTDVSAAEVRAYVGSLGAREQAALAKDPALVNQAVRALLANRIVLQQALDRKWDRQPGIAAQIERARENAIVESYLQAMSTPPAGYPSDEELEKVYDANRATFLVPRQFEVGQIFVPLPKGADRDAEEKAKEKVDEIVRRLEVTGTDFAATARQYGSSGDGSLGWLSEQQIRPEIRTRLMSLAKDAITDPIKLEDGWHILKLIDTRAAYTATLPEIRDQLVQQIRTERANVLRRNFISDLLKRNPPYLNELALTGLMNPSPPGGR